MYRGLFTVGVAVVGVMYNADGTVSSNDVIFANSLTDYSYINARDGDPDGAQLARCMTGLGPSGTDNNALGRLYFNENRIPNGACGSSVVQPNGTSVDDFVGVIDMFQCGEFSPSVEGVYTCTMMSSSMTDQSIRLGIYFTGRSELSL